MLWLALYYLRRGRIQEALIFAEIGYAPSLYKGCQASTLRIG